MNKKEINLRKNDKVIEIIEKVDKWNNVYGSYTDNYIKMEIPYSEFNEIVNDIVFRKKIVLDLTKFSNSNIKYFFDNFDMINGVIGGYYCYNQDDKYRGNHSLIFIYSEEQKEIIDKYKYDVKNNMNYMLKDFIIVDEAKKIKESKIVLDKEQNIYVDDKKINISGFNMIHGANGSGKTLLLKSISKKFGVPIFDLYNFSDGNREIESSEVFKYIYKLLTNKEVVKRYSSSEHIFYWLCVALSYGQLENKLVLLDEMCWNILDTRNKINVVDNLNNYSYSNGVVATSCHNDIKGLVKRRVYNPNIIDL